MIKLTHFNLQRGNKLLFEHASLTIYPGHKIGIVGANGCGKSSLFALLHQEIEVDTGTCDIPKDWVIAHVAQETPALDQSALDYVLDGDRELRDIESHLAIEMNGDKIAQLHARLESIEGYTASVRAAQLLHGIGFQQKQIQLPVKSFSGGWRMRLNLAQALMCRSDLLLLDEPTNHLDLDAIIWLEQWLQGYQGTLLMISHDRDFLDNVATEIVQVENQKLNSYSGNYSAFEKIRAEKLAQQQTQHEKQQREISHLQQYVDRFRYKASKAKQAQSRLKAIGKMDIIAAVHASSRFRFQFKPVEKVSNPLLSIKDVVLGYHNAPILNNINLSIAPGDRIGLLGPNGAGKSTLIKYLATALTSIQGERVDGHHLKIAYFAQHQIDHLDSSASPMLHLQRLDHSASDQVLRNFLGSFAFHNDQIFETIHHFSGGEKSRLALALLVWQQPNLILLDEPTNHLDMDMRDALTLALQGFEGAMIIVSHDRHLLRSSVDQFYLVANQHIEPYAGDLQDYKTWLIDHRRLQQEGKANKVKQKVDLKQKRRQTAAEREVLKPLKKKIEQLERNIAKLTEKLKNIEHTLADEIMYMPESKDQLQDVLKAQASTKTELEQTEVAWLDASEQLSQTS